MRRSSDISQEKSFIAAPEAAPIRTDNLVPTTPVMLGISSKHAAST